MLEKSVEENEYTSCESNVHHVRVRKNPLLHLDGFVTVGTVVDDGERLLETGPTNTDDISNQLTHSDHHLE